MWNAISQNWYHIAILTQFKRIVIQLSFQDPDCGAFGAHPLSFWRSMVILFTKRANNMIYKRYGKFVSKMLGYRNWESLEICRFFFFSDLPKFSWGGPLGPRLDLSPKVLCHLHWADWAHVLLFSKSLIPRYSLDFLSNASSLLNTGFNFHLILSDIGKR